MTDVRLHNIGAAGQSAVNRATSPLSARVGAGEHGPYRIKVRTGT